MTGVTISNHAVVKMNGVIDVVDAIGGVKMCLPEALHGDPRSARIDLPRARTGSTARPRSSSSAYARARAWGSRWAAT